MATPGSRDVDIVLPKTGRATMRATILARRMINRTVGPIGEVIRKVGNVDTDAIAAVIAFGIGKGDGNSINEIDEELFEGDTTQFIGPVTEYLLNLTGRPMDKEGEDGKDKNPPK